MRRAHDSARSETRGIVGTKPVMNIAERPALLGRIQRESLQTRRTDGNPGRAVTPQNSCKSGGLSELDRSSYKQEVGGSSPSPPIQPKGLQSGHLGTELEFHRRLSSGALGCSRGASESEEADRGVSKRGGCGRAGHIHPVVTRTPLWATECGAPGLRGGPLVLPTTAFGATNERGPVRPEVARSSPVAPVGESDCPSRRDLGCSAEPCVRHRKPPEVRPRQKNGDQNGEHQRPPRAPVLR
jgi:hypothetical protein